MLVFIPDVIDMVVMEHQCLLGLLIFKYHLKNSEAYGLTQAFFLNMSSLNVLETGFETVSSTKKLPRMRAVSCVEHDVSQPKEVSNLAILMLEVYKYRENALSVSIWYIPVEHSMIHSVS